MPLYVAGSGCASWGAKYHQRLDQPPVRTTLSGSLASAAGSSSVLAFSRDPSVLRREQQLCNSNSPPLQIRPWVCCMLRDTALSKPLLISDLPHLNCCHWLWLRENNPSCSRAPTHPPGTRTIFSFEGGWSRAFLAQPGRPALPPSEAGQDLPGHT